MGELKPLLWYVGTDRPTPEKHASELWTGLGVGRAYFVLALNRYEPSWAVLHLITPCCGSLTRRRATALQCGTCGHAYPLGTKRPVGHRPLGEGSYEAGLRRWLEAWLETSGANPLEAVVWADEVLALPFPTVAEMRPKGLPVVGMGSVARLLHASWQAWSVEDPAL